MVEGRQVLAAGLGAGSKGVVAGLLSGVSGGSLLAGVPGDVITGGIGYLMADRMNGFGSDFGLGLFIASLGNIVKTPIEAIFKTSPTTPTTPPAPKTTAPVASGVDSYLSAQYGI